MFNLVKPMKRLLSAVQSFFKLSSVNIPQALTKAKDQTLPAALSRELNSAIEELSPPVIQIDRIGEALTKSLRCWQDNDTMPNVIVVLADPIQPTDRLLAAVVEHAQAEFTQLHINRLDNWSKRPSDYATTEAVVRNAIATIVKEQPSDDVIKLVVIPTLEHYFLRCIDGLEAIEAIRQAIVDHRNYFWLVGCNRWAWHYLDKVCYLSAYLEHSFELPTLKALELRHWLTPLDQIAGLAPFASSSYSEHQQSSRQQKNAAQNGESFDNLLPWRSESEKEYFEDIEKKTKGIAPIAAAVWLSALEYDLVDPADDQSHQHPDHQDMIGSLRRGQIELPDVPLLTADERFLIYAILLHGSLSIQHLALSLDEPEGKVQAQLQALSRQRVIIKKMSGWTVNPVYFLGLRKDLDRNNFLLG
ncbi:MAG: hypothetical protein AAF327_00495 [Cyanobacteria bacterium P01_A01_bin.37]